MSYVLERIVRRAGWQVTTTYVDPVQRMRLWLASAARIVKAQHESQRAMPRRPVTLGSQ